MIDLLGEGKEGKELEVRLEKLLKVELYLFYLENTLYTVLPLV